jgi:hypothetical protein
LTNPQPNEKTTTKNVANNKKKLRKNRISKQPEIATGKKQNGSTKELTIKSPYGEIMLRAELYVQTMHEFLVSKNKTQAESYNACMILRVGDTLFIRDDGQTLYRIEIPELISKTKTEESYEPSVIFENVHIFSVSRNYIVATDLNHLVQDSHGRRTL